MDRESILPLLLGALVALVVHVVLLPLAASSWPHDRAPLAKDDAKQAESQPQQVNPPEPEKTKPLPPSPPPQVDQSTAPAPRDPVAAAGLPDLHILAIQSPPTARKGDTLPVDFVIGNRGGASTSQGPWRDRVYLSLNPTLDKDDWPLATIEQREPLLAGGRYAALASGRVELPPDVAGQMFLIVQTDADGNVPESDEQNNIRAVPIDIDEVALGKDKSTAPLAVAWIAYDDFRKLVAQRSVVDQPTVQDKVDPIAQAPTPRNPTPPGAAAASQPSAAPTASASAPSPPLFPAEGRGDGKKRPTASTSPATLQPPIAAAPQAKRIEATSPASKPSLTPVELPKADAADAPIAPPKPQAPAEGPRVEAELVKQPKVESPRAGVSVPGSQVAAALPQPIFPLTDPDAPRTDPKRNDPVTQDPARSLVAQPSPQPAQQPRGDTPQPQPGVPSQQAKADAPPAAAGVPATSPEAKTPTPTPRGDLATATPVNGQATEDATSPDTEQPDRPQGSTQSNAKTPDSDASAAARSDQPAARPQPASAAADARPTSSPREEGDIPPAIIEKTEMPITPGGVITRPGIQIVAYAPEITATSWIISGPTAVNPVAKITFDAAGRVRFVELKRSTGHANLDSPIVAAFYNFRAKGEKLQLVRDSFTVTIRLLLKDERKDTQ
jgi:hypothetical protein